MPDFETQSLRDRISELDDLETHELADLEHECREDIQNAKDFLRRSLRFFEAEEDMEVVKGNSVPHEPLETMDYFSSDIKDKADWLEKNVELLRETVSRLEDREEY